MSKARAEHAIAVHGVHKAYKMGKVTLKVLRGLNFRAEPGEFVAVVGASGSGKSTLLHVIGLLDRPDTGRVVLHGLDASGLSARKRNAVRCRDVGFVFQFYHLMPELNVRENVLLPAMVDTSTFGWLARRGQLRKRADEVLEHVGLRGRIRHRPSELSGGERQRVAIARALMNRPRILLADEPTGNLDSKTGRHIIKLLERCNREDKQTIIMVTHDATLAAEAQRTVTLTDGTLQKR